MNPRDLVAPLALAAFDAGILTIEKKEDRVSLYAKVLGLRVSLIACTVKTKAEVEAEERRAAFRSVS